MDKLYLEYVDALVEGKERIVALTGRNSVVGDIYTVKNDTKNKVSTIINRFDEEVAEISWEDSQQLRILKNQGLTCGASLAWVAINGDTQEHFAKFLLWAYDANDEDCTNYLIRFRTRLSRGVRPNPDTSKFVMDKITETHGQWMNPDIELKPKLPKNCTTIKSHMEFVDKLIDAGRNKNPGCFLGAIVFFGLIAFLIFMIIKFVTGF